MANSWTGRQLIDGKWLDGGAMLENRNPAKFAEVIGKFPRGTADDANKAVAAARKAFPGWRKTSRIKRGELFIKLAELIRRDVQKLAETLARESGKIVDEARA